MLVPRFPALDLILISTNRDVADEVAQGLLASIRFRSEIMPIPPGSTAPAS